MRRGGIRIPRTERIAYAKAQGKRENFCFRRNEMKFGVAGNAKEKGVLQDDFGEVDRGRMTHGASES